MNSIARIGRILSIVGIILILSCHYIDSHKEYDVIVLGAGTGGVSAAIQAARIGANTLYINPLEWHGGMATSAGVSAIDGNDQLPSGLWGEWRALLRQHYGGADSLFTGWVSKTMFEPWVGAYYWNQLVEAEDLLEVRYNTQWEEIKYDDSWYVHLGNKSSIVKAKILIDATDLGDVAAQLGVKYDIGIDSRYDTGEEWAPEKAYPLIQDMTYTAILKEFSDGDDHIVIPPEDYSADLFRCSCNMFCDDKQAHACQKMMTYGLLPNDKYMINWPIHGNDTYLNVIDLTPDQRHKEYQSAKNRTLGFVYYIQKELGYDHFGLSDEFGTHDHLPLMPYHREGRRIKGVVRLDANHLIRPFEFTLYRTGIAVGDYPIDHHHKENPSLPDFDYPSIPSYNVPMGCLIPENVDHLLVADKAISVTHIVNGTTRLQPVVIQIGQVAGLMAAISARDDIIPANLDVRMIQSMLLDEHVYLMPYLDVPATDLDFKPIQRMGATGILRGEGMAYRWANQTWFYPDSLMTIDELRSNLIDYDDSFTTLAIGRGQVTKTTLELTIRHWNSHAGVLQDKPLIYRDKGDHDPLTRREIARLLDDYMDPFSTKKIDQRGNWY